MKAVIQRVSTARVRVEGRTVGAIGEGLVVLLGVARDDTVDQVTYIADKILNLRIFADGNNRMNRSILDVEGEILLISQFTLLGNTRKGRRPNFTAAAPGDLAEELYLQVQNRMARQVPVKTGIFGAMMEVSLSNDGPVTLIIESA